MTEGIFNTTQPSNSTNESIYAATLREVKSGERSDYIELYTYILQSAIEILGVPEDTNSFLIFLTTIIIVSLGVLLVGVFNIYCTNRGRRSAKKFYQNHGGDMSLRALSPKRQRSQSHSGSTDHTL